MARRPMEIFIQYKVSPDASAEAVDELFDYLLGRFFGKSV